MASLRDNDEAIGVKKGPGRGPPLAGGGHWGAVGGGEASQGAKDLCRGNVRSEGENIPNPIPTSSGGDHRTYRWDTT